LHKKEPAEQSSHNHTRQLSLDGSSNRNHATVEFVSTYTPLILSLFYFVSVDRDTTSASTIALLIGLYFVHLALYRVMAKAKPQHKTLAMVGSIVLSFAAAPINPSSFAFYWYSIYFAALHMTVRRALTVSGVIGALIFAVAQLYDYSFYWYYMPAIVPSVAMFGHGFYERKAREFAEAQKQSQQELQQLAKVAERERIARDLHDVMGHSLATIALKSQLAEKQGKAGHMEAALKEIAEVSKITSETLSEMRAVISGYKFRSIETHADKLIKSLQDANFHVHSVLELPEMNAKNESTLALILTEAVTNIIKHSNGNEVKIAAHIDESDSSSQSQFLLRISDNGQVESLTEGNGMQGMHERINELGGSLTSHYQGRTELVFRVPVTKLA
jgi:two-component system sensor histidine kinase DesK